MGFWAAPVRSPPCSGAKRAKKVMRRTPVICGRLGGRGRRGGNVWARRGTVRVEAGATGADVARAVRYRG
jgi:hypothetical protein